MGVCSRQQEHLNLLLREREREREIFISISPPSCTFLNHRFINTENKLLVVRGKGSGGIHEIGEQSHKDEKYGIGNIVSNIIITLYDDRW